MKLNIKERKYYNFDLERLNSLLEGDLSYVGTFNVEDRVCEVFKAKKPNKKKGHRKYVLIYKENDSFMITGVTPYQMKKHRTQAAVECLNCNVVLYSLHRHDYHLCGCDNEVFVDGGRDYLRAGYKNKSQFRTLVIDLITKKEVNTSNDV